MCYILKQQKRNAPIQTNPPVGEAGGSALPACVAPVFSPVVSPTRLCGLSGRSVTQLQEALADVTVQPLRRLAVTIWEKCVIFYFRAPRGQPHFEHLPFCLPHIGFSCQKNFSNA